MNRNESPATVPVRLPRDLRDRLEARARQGERSLAGEVRLAVRRHLGEPVAAKTERE